MAKRPPHADDELFAELIDAGSREHYADADLYDYEYRRRRADVNFYREIAKQRFAATASVGTILELGAGSGRVTVPLLRDGHQVVAIDQSQAMLHKLEARRASSAAAVAERLQIVKGDLRDFNVPATKRSTKGASKQFDLIIAAFNVLEHLYTRVELAASLRQVDKHLAPGGAFVFDVQMPDLPWLCRDPNKRWAKTKFTDPATGKKFMYSTNHEYDPVTQIALIRIFYEPIGHNAKPRVIKLSQRKFFPAELEALIAASGFKVSARYGDFAGKELDETAASQVLVCERSRSKGTFVEPTR
jgi:SAM-dependent methyltransferase